MGRCSVVVSSRFQLLLTLRATSNSLYTRLFPLHCLPFRAHANFVYRYGPEIAPLRYRHIGGAAGAFGEWLFSFITVFAGGIALDRVGSVIWIWMLLSAALAIPFVIFMCPETTGKTLEEVDMIFARHSSALGHTGKQDDEITHRTKSGQEEVLEKEVV